MRKNGREAGEERAAGVARATIVDVARRAGVSKSTVSLVLGGSSLVAEAGAYKVYQVRWPVLPGVDGEGLLVEPKGDAIASIVAIPDADQTPELLLGLDGKHAGNTPFALRLAAAGCRVIIPVLVNRQCTFSASSALGRETNISHREFIWRMSYEMGRHILGFEIQKVLAAVDWTVRMTR